MVQIADRGDEFTGSAGAENGHHQVERLGLDLNFMSTLVTSR